ncbi:TIGR03862 family flavoprotein [Lacimonas salitolerans]|uniref:TIGR03862 family flavoprotein n=1 Tax=Lacimonas salitolerans TaxID=1323750 RepID=A0ABW4EFZ4_9RHOB
MTDALIIGAGPAGLMAAEALARAGRRVLVTDAMPSPARKFLMAGKSGLNLTKDEPFDAFVAAYGSAAPHLHPMLAQFGPDQVQAWARDLGQEVFTGTSGRVFPTAMKASPLLRAWLARLDRLGVTLHRRWRWTGWDGDAVTFDTPEGQQTLRPAVTVLACGGASWARLGSDGAWADWTDGTVPFQPSNAALALPWTDHMTAHFGAPLKTVEWQAGGITSRGEAVITAHGLEGGGLYTLTPALRAGAALTVDLLPDLGINAIGARLPRGKTKARLAHWLKNTLRLPPAKIALFFEMTGGAALHMDQWAQTLKSLPIRIATLRPLDHAISTAGGLRFDALDAGLMLRDRPGTFAAGEMLDWEAPTGGYLLTACFATGLWAGQHAARYRA